MSKFIHHLSLSFMWVMVIAVFMRLFREFWSEWRYFSNRKSHPSGVRAPIKNTAMVMSTGRLETERAFSLAHRLINTESPFYFESWPHGAVRFLPLVEEMGGFGHTGRIVPDAAEQQQVTPQHSLRNWSRVIPLLLINQPPKQVHDVALRHTCSQSLNQCWKGFVIRHSDHLPPPVEWCHLQSTMDLLLWLFMQ